MQDSSAKVSYIVTRVGFKFFRYCTVFYLVVCMADLEVGAVIAVWILWYGCITISSLLKSHATLL